MVSRVSRSGWPALESRPPTSGHGRSATWRHPTLEGWLMRYALIALWMIGFVLLVSGLNGPPASAQIAPTSNTVTVTSNKSGTHFTIIGPYQTTREDASQAALARAQKEIVG